jgi:hypothetical protein
MDIAGFAPAFGNIHDFKRKSQPPRLTHQPTRPDTPAAPRPEAARLQVRKENPSHQRGREEFPAPALEWRKTAADGNISSGCYIGSNGVSLLREHIGAGDLFFNQSSYGIFLITLKFNKL